MKRTEIITRLLTRAAYEDALGPTSEGDMLRQAAAFLLEDEIEHSRSAVVELAQRLERLNNGIQSG